MNKNNDQLRKMMQQAQALIQAKRYDEARAILEKVVARSNNEKARRWLVKLDAIAPKQSLLQTGMDKVVPRKRRWMVYVAIGVLLSCCFFTILGAIVGPPPASLTATAIATAATDTDTPMPTDTSAPTDTPVPSATATITNTPVPTLTPTVTNTPAPTSTPVPTNPPVADAGLEATKIESNLRGLTDVDMRDVQIADGRANGGERVAIITYVSTASDEVGLVAEWFDIFTIVGATMQDQNIDLDTVSIVIGDDGGMAVGVAYAAASDVLAFVEGRLTNEAFFLRVTLETF